MRVKKACVLAISVLAFAAAGPARGAAGGNGGNGNQDQKKIEQEVKRLTTQLENKLRQANRAYDRLTGKSRKSFVELRELARIRQRLMDGLDIPEELRDELQGLSAQITDLITQLDDPDLILERPELTEDQKAAIAAQKEQMQVLRDQLEEALIAESLLGDGEYAELAGKAKEELTPQERARLAKLRRQLLETSAEAQAKLEEMQQSMADFHETNPDLPVPKHRVVKHMRRNAEAIQTIHATIDEILSRYSEEYAALLAAIAADPTPEKLVEKLALRRTLSETVPEVAALMKAVTAIRGRMVNQIRKRIRKSGKPLGPPVVGRPGAGQGETTTPGE